MALISSVDWHSECFDPPLLFALSWTDLKVSLDTDKAHPPLETESSNLQVQIALLSYQLWSDSLKAMCVSFD